MAFKIKRFIPSSPLQEVAGPGKGKKNTTDRKVVRKLARQAAKDSKEGKSTLIETNNSSRSQKGSGKSTTYNSKDGNKKVNKREIKKALKGVIAPRRNYSGDKVNVSDGEIKVIKGTKITKDQRIAALKKKKADGVAKKNAGKAKRLKMEAAKREAYKKKKADGVAKLNAAKAKRLEMEGAKREAYKKKQAAARAKKKK